MADIPPGPWTWQRVHPLPVDDEDTKEVREERWGEALVAADDTWLLSSESGWGRPEVHPQLRKLLPLTTPTSMARWLRPMLRSGCLRRSGV